MSLLRESIGQVRVQVHYDVSCRGLFFQTMEVEKHDFGLFRGLSHFFAFVFAFSSPPTRILPLLLAGCSSALSDWLVLFFCLQLVLSGLANLAQSNWFSEARG